MRRIRNILIAAWLAAAVVFGLDLVAARPAVAGLPSAALSLAKDAAPNPVVAGTNLTYTLTVSNEGPGNADACTLNDPLPTGTTFVSLTVPAGWSCTTPAIGGTGTVNCTNSSFAPGSDSFTLVVAIPASTPDGTIVTNTADVSSTTPNPQPGKTTATTNTPVIAVADLTVTKSDAPDPVVAGSNLTYTLSVSNAGPSVAVTVALDDPLPAGTTFVSLAAAAGWSCSTPAVGANGNVNCTIASLPVGSNAFTLVVHVSSGTANGATLTNTATLTTLTTDPTPADQAATATTGVVASADLQVTKSGLPLAVTPGGNITYAIVVTNAGPSDAASVTLNDPLPPGTTFQSILSPPGWSCVTPAVGANGAVSCSVALLAAGGSASFTLVVGTDPAATGALVNTATAAATTTDPTPGNNAGVATNGFIVTSIPMLDARALVALAALVAGAAIWVFRRAG